MADQATFAPHEAAEMVGTTVHSIRRWCEWHSVHLSPGAHPGTNAPRRLTARDIEVLKAVRDLRAQGLATPAINDRLASMAFAEPAPTDTLALAETGLNEAQAPIVVYQALTTVQEQIAALQQAQAAHERNQRDVWVAFMAGAILSALFVLLIVLLFVLFRGGM